MGQYIIYKTLKDYWANDLPVNKGQKNFKFLRYDYYRDETVSLEAFKAGEYDLRQEGVSKYWATLYKGPNFDKGHIIKEEIAHDIPQGMQALVFNIKEPVFNDPRVREALNYSMDFEWMNKNLFFGQYTRTRSYFQNTKYEAKGLPSKGELKILEPLRGKIPDRVFSEEYNPPVTDGSGNIRKQLRKALGLLKEAGWEVKDRILTNIKTGEPFEFELLIYSPTMERIAIPVQNNLKRMGIKMTIRQVDTTQFTNRMRNRDFDMISQGYSANPYPSANLKIIWHSDYIDFTYNTAGVQDPAVDLLVEGIAEAQDDEELLLDYGRALDRVLQWNFYVIPEWHISKFRVAYWNRFSRPKIRPKYDLGIDTWWIDKEKEKRLPKRNVGE
jgi:microcin C transport system substrate-binding protein